MKSKNLNARLIIFVGLLAAGILWITPFAFAGGPLAIVDGRAVRWARNEIRGGLLNSATVDAQGNVLYRVDSGRLGTLSEEQATAFVDRIFGEYSSIPTSTIRFVNAGRIIDPTTNQPVNVTGENAGRFIGKTPTFQNPIIFDSDGSITGSGGVLGIFGLLQVDDPTAELREGFVVLNGAPLSKGSIEPTSFLGVFTHEFGHFAGPLDHSQINGNIASDEVGSILPPSFNGAQTFDLFAPFVETLYPFIFPAPAGSQLHNQFGDSGFFVATLDMDTRNALSNLYPTPGYLSDNGSIEGRVLLNLGGNSIAISGINVVARRIDQGQFPPALGTVAFATAPTLDSDGVPSIPSPQPATDPLSTVSSAVTGLDFGTGAYRIQGLPPGRYMVEIQQINPDAIRGSGIGPLGTQFPLPIKEEFFNGPGNSSNTAGLFLPVTVTAGAVTGGIDFTINGITNVTPAPASEIEPNEKTKKAQKLSIPVELSGSASETDDAALRISLPDGSQDPIEDLYKITIDHSTIVFVLLQATSGTGDLDLYLFSSNVNKKRTSLDDPNLLSFSAGPTANELIGVALDPGTYIIGVSAFAGSMNYKMQIFTSQ